MCVEIGFSFGFGFKRIEVGGMFDFCGEMVESEVFLWFVWCVCGFDCLLLGVSWMLLSVCVVCFVLFVD